MRAIIAVAAIIVLGAGSARAEDQPARADVWSLKLGTPVAALPLEAFIEYACGSNASRVADMADEIVCFPLDPNRNADGSLDTLVVAGGL